MPLSSPEPEPHFSAATCTLLDRAAAQCTQAGSQLTALRRSVLGHLIEHGRPAGAYEVLQWLGRPAPPTVYRSLDFLIGAGLVHKLERLSAYIACTRHLHEDHAHHAVQFLICGACGRAEEMEDVEVRTSLVHAAARYGFTLNAAVIEAEGTCADCTARAELPA